jgi:phage terminase small subunit
MDKLTGKQQRFVDEYIVCLNGTEAARRAGYAGDENSLSVIASQNLRKVNIARAISARLAEFAMPANEVLTQLTDIARGDMSDNINNFGGIDPVQAARRGKGHLIKRFKVKTITTEDSEIVETEIEMYDRLKALEILSKYHNLTNTIKVDDWHTEIINLLKQGKVTPDEVVEELGDNLAEELFKSAGIPLLTGGEG